MNFRFGANSSLSHQANVYSCFRPKAVLRANYYWSRICPFTKVIASIEDPMVIRKILAHLDDNAASAASGLLPECGLRRQSVCSAEKINPNHIPGPLLLIW
jgi:hypothetical protein